MRAMVVFAALGVAGCASTQTVQFQPSLWLRIFNFRFGVSETGSTRRKDR
jgi:hypothetical protein